MRRPKRQTPGIRRCSAGLQEEAGGGGVGPYMVTRRTAAESRPHTDRLESDVLCSQCLSRGGLVAPRAVASL